MSQLTDQERERFSQDKALLEILVELTDAENSQPGMRIENAIFALLEAAAKGDRFGAVAFEHRRDLREVMGPRLELAMHRFQQQFEIKLKPDYISGEEKRLARQRERELQIFFMERVIHLDKVENKHRDEALLIAARETQARARAVYGHEPKHWRVVGPRSLQERFAQIAEGYERKGYLPPDFTGDGRILPNQYSITDLRGKRGGPQKMRRRRV